jgi:hypothetical protein
VTRTRGLRRDRPLRRPRTIKGRSNFSPMISALEIELCWNALRLLDSAPPLSRKLMGRNMAAPGGRGTVRLYRAPRGGAGISTISCRRSRRSDGSSTMPPCPTKPWGRSWASCGSSRHESAQALEYLILATTRTSETLLANWSAPLLERSHPAVAGGFGLTGRLSLQTRPGPARRREDEIPHPVVVDLE